MNIFAARNWSRYSREFAHDNAALYRYKRVILLSQFTLFGAVIGILHALEDIVDGLLFMPMMDFIMACVIFTCYIINEKGFHRAAKLLLVGFLNIFFFVYCSLAEKELGIFLFYFPWIGLAAVIFEPHERFERIFFILLSSVLLIALFITKFQAFGSAPFAAVDFGKSFIINMVSSIVVLLFFILFMIRMNVENEKRLFSLAQEIKEKNDSLEKTNKELDRFLYSASHDLRSPLMSIKGLAEIIQNEAGEEKIKKYMSLMNDRIDKLDFFIQDIIDYSRNAKTEVKLEAIELNELLNEVLESFQYLEGASSISVERNILVTRTLMLDKGRLLIILSNLISNAIKYHTIRDRRFIKIQAQEIDNQLKISIADNGQGIAEEHIGKIFNMFYRASSQSKGSGLGLYIVREALEKLRGSITVDSQLNVGTTFYLTIPLA